MQAPAVHASERVESHAVHAAPVVPHFESEGVVHVLFAQQPVGQEPFAPTVHWQLPLTQAWPTAHCRPEPQAHCPTGLQLSLRVVSHATHAMPPFPHVACDCRGGPLQLTPEQQPVRQVDAQPEHAPFVQLSPLGHWLQAPPPLPHAPVVVPGWHCPPTQHPVPHDTRSHTHIPFRQR